LSDHPTLNEAIHLLFDRIVSEADGRIADEAEDDPTNDGWDSREDMRGEPEWAEMLFRVTAEVITEISQHLGGHFWPDDSGSCARQAWFGEDFNYGTFQQNRLVGGGWDRPELESQWNAAFLYNASEGMTSMIRAVAYEFARRGYLPPHSVGKNVNDFREGGSLA